MNDESKKSSSQQLNTTHFKNKNVLGNNSKFVGFQGVRPITPRNNSINNNPDNRNLDNNRDFIPPTNATNENNNSNLSNERGKQKSRENVDNVNRGTHNPFGPKNRLNDNVNKLRDALDTNPNLKDEAVKKGAEALKKSANPYAKAAGYATSIMQRRKEKKEKEDKEKEESEDNNYDDDIDEQSTSTTERRMAIIKKILPILLMLAPMFLIFLLIIAIIAPIINGYSWFYSIFNHNTDDADSYYIYNQNQEKYLQQEKDFNEAIVGSKDGSVKGIIKEYQEKYGVTLDRNLLVATVTYRYTAVDSDKLYTDDGTEDLIEENIEDNLENNDDTGSNNLVDYSAAKKKIKVVADLMLINNGGSYTTDNKVGGEYYNKLIDSSFLKSYYKPLLINNEYETRKKIVDEIFEYAEGAKELFDENTNPVNGGVIGDTSITHLQTCDQPYATKEINNLKVFNNPSWSKGTNYPDYLNVKDYIKGVVSREIGVSSDYKEAMKAQAIIALSYLIHDFRSGFNLKSGEMYFPSGTCRQATCSPTDGCTSVAVAGTNLHTNYVGQHRFSGGSSHGPISESNNAILEEILSDVFGKIMVNKGITSATYSGSGDTIHTSFYNSITNKNCHIGTCFGQIEAMKDARNGMTYEQILNKYYSSVDFDIINITEGLYTSVGFDNSEYNGTIVYYSQTNYSNAFCGRSNATIAGSGCGVTSSAIIASSLTGNRQYDPVYMMNWAHQTGQCGAGISGTNSGFFEIFAKGLGLGYEQVDKSQTDKVVNALKTGNSLIIAHMGPGHFTSGGHYIVLSALNDKGEVYVNDPNGNRRSGYWDINLIANELNSYGSFHIISKK